MADLLPSNPDPSAGDGGEPKVIGVDSEEADDLLAALQSETARDLLGILYDEPATPSQLADEADTSIQNVRYHLEKLTDADLVEVADTIYSEKGREMKVYAPVARPLVVFAGNEEETPGIEAALSRLLGGLGILATSSLLVQRIATRGALVPDVGFSAGSGGGGDAAEGTTEAETAWQGSNVSATTQLEEEAATEKMAETTRTVADGGQTATQATQTATEAAETATEATRTATEATQTASEATTTASEAVRQTTEEAARVTTTAAEATTVADTTTITEAAGGAVTGLPPGLLFFAGGVVVLLGFVAAQYLRVR